MSFHGFLVIDKPQGLSSHQVISRLRKLLQFKKIGHTGTLDPLATGVLPMALGEATKVIAYLDEAQKCYEVEAVLGTATDTYDAEGRVTECVAVPPISDQALQECLQSFLGKQQQLPPLYSAIKVQGKPAYAYARKGEELKLKPREVTIHHLELIASSSDSLCLRVQCSRGTYVRSLIHDLGLRLGTRAHISKLRRLQSGTFNLTQAVTLEEVEALGVELPKKILSIERCLGHLESFPLGAESDLIQVKNGVILPKIIEYFQNIKDIHKIFTLSYEEKVRALMRLEEGTLSYLRVLQPY